MILGVGSFVYRASSVDPFVTFFCVAPELEPTSVGAKSRGTMGTGCMVPRQSLRESGMTQFLEESLET